MSVLALILFLPWFAVVGGVFWLLPREVPRSAGRSRFDAIALLLAFAVSAIGMVLGLDTDATGHHPIWKQVMACLYAYAGFIGVLAVALFVRARRRSQPSP